MKEIELCPIGDSQSLFSRKWIFCILNNMFWGAKYFNDFKKANPQISNHVLSQTLKYLEENKLISKSANDNRAEYSLTPKGKKTNRILFELALYSLDELDNKSLDEHYKNEIIQEFKIKLKIDE